jgi:hypothetical protein
LKDDKRKGMKVIIIRELSVTKLLMACLKISVLSFTTG